MTSNICKKKNVRTSNSLSCHQKVCHNVCHFWLRVSLFITLSIPTIFRPLYFVPRSNIWLNQGSYRELKIKLPKFSMWQLKNSRSVVCCKVVNMVPTRIDHQLPWWYSKRIKLQSRHHAHITSPPPPPPRHTHQCIHVEQSQHDTGFNYLFTLLHNNLNTPC